MFKLLLVFKYEMEERNIKLKSLRLMSNSLPHLIFVIEGLRPFFETFTIYDVEGKNEVMNESNYIEKLADMDLNGRNNGNEESDFFAYIPEVARRTGRTLPKPKYK